MEAEKDKKVTRVLVNPEEIAEAITRAFEEKGEKVKKAIGEPEGNYLKEVNRLHKGNVGKFTIGKIIEKDVRERTINQVMERTRSHTLT